MAGPLAALAGWVHSSGGEAQADQDLATWLSRYLNAEDAVSCESCDQVVLLQFCFWWFQPSAVQAPPDEIRRGLYICGLSQTQAFEPSSPMTWKWKIHRCRWFSRWITTSRFPIAMIDYRMFESNHITWGHLFWITLTSWSSAACRLAEAELSGTCCGCSPGHGKLCTMIAGEWFPNFEYIFVYKFGKYPVPCLVPWSSHRMDVTWPSQATHSERSR